MTKLRLTLIAAVCLATTGCYFRARGPDYGPGERRHERSGESDRGHGHEGGDDREHDHGHPSP